MRRVSPFTDLRNVRGGIKSDPKHYKSEGNISSIELAPSLNGSQWPEFLCSNHTGQEHSMEAVVVQLVQSIRLLPTSTFIIKVNDKICPNLTANININTPNTLDPTIEVTQHKHKFS